MLRRRARKKDRLFMCASTSVYALYVTTTRAPRCRSEVAIFAGTPLWSDRRDFDMKVFPMTTPLAGITVLDFGQIYQGPYATMLMAKAGANVIKIEPPGGEPLRRRAIADRRRDHPADGDAERQQACA